ncbi:DNA alkylation repair protein [Metabacillus fastidiosus]|uniref:DNA alkylation repair protein n=1 Tax=Metabacillus fastidiosus TaxID=1458 RepID=UPI002DB9BD09|nr:DNA alkylation repair protein [Metabacillus fastidiosus]MEC2078180.1 DNA alkylation repair protein [Metabacillus fastidiosus]
MSNYIPLKNYFDARLAQLLSNKISPIYSGFPHESFIKRVDELVEGLELKDRVAVITKELHKALNLPYVDALNVLKQIMGPENKTEKGMFTNGYFLMPIAHYVEVYGLNDFDESMDALYEITKCHTSEYAIRPFLIRYERQVLERLHIWAVDENAHVRRLVSEGTRPRLPWAKRMDVLCGDPLTNLTLLEQLITDNSQYVKKSVGNHLNDLSKMYKEETMRWIENMHKLHGNKIIWIIKHGLRSLVKAKDRNALEFIRQIGG